MKTRINGFLIVEGNADKAFLSSFLDCHIIVLGGYAIKEETINFINRLGEKLTPIILCDPDEAGLKIADKIHKRIPNSVVVHTEIKTRKHYKKTGIAETAEEEIIDKLKPFITDKDIITGDIVPSWLISYLMKTGRLIEDIQNKYQLGNVNIKQTVNRLNALGVTREEIKLWK
jgi:ribonuclease M5